LYVFLTLSDGFRGFAIPAFLLFPAVTVYRCSARVVAGISSALHTNIIFTIAKIIAVYNQTGARDGIKISILGPDVLVVQCDGIVINAVGARA